jgi:hypothetical protein
MILLMEKTDLFVTSVSQFAPPCELKRKDKTFLLTTNLDQTLGLDHLRICLHLQ